MLNVKQLFSSSALSSLSPSFSCRVDSWKKCLSHYSHTVYSALVKILLINRRPMKKRLLQMLQEWWRWRAKKITICMRTVDPHAWLRERERENAVTIWYKLTGFIGWHGNYKETRSIGKTRRRADGSEVKCTVTRDATVMSYVCGSGKCVNSIDCSVNTFSSRVYVLIDAFFNKRQYSHHSIHLFS